MPSSTTGSRIKGASKKFALFVVAFATFSDVFIYGLVVPVMPFALRQRIGIPQDEVQQWNSALLGVLGSATAIGSIAAGVLSDRYNTRRIPFFIGLLSLFISTLIFAVSKVLYLLIIARVFQGLSTAVVCTVGYAFLADKYGASNHSSESKGFGQAMGWVSSALSLGWFVGPVVGGWIYESSLGYMGVFVPALACVGLEIALLLRLFAREREQRRASTIHGLDASKGDENEEDAQENGKAHGGYRTMINGHGAVGGAVETPSPSDETDTDVDIEPRPAEATPLLAKTSRPASSASPTRPPRPALFILLSSPHLVCSILSLTLCDALLTSFDAVLPVYLAQTYRLDSSQISLVFLALVMPLLTGPIFGGLAERMRDGMRKLTCAGFVLSGLGFAAMGLLDILTNKLRSWEPSTDADKPPPPLVYLLPILVFLGFSFALALTPLTACISHLIGRIEQRTPGVFGDNGANAQAYGLAHVGLGIGLVVGPMGSGYLKERLGWDTMCLICAGTCLVGFALSAYGVSGGGSANAEDLNEEA